MVQCVDCGLLPIVCSSVLFWLVRKLILLIRWDEGCADSLDYVSFRCQGAGPGVSLPIASDHLEGAP